MCVVKFVDGHHEAEVECEHGCTELNDACVMNVPVPFAIQPSDDGVLTQYAPDEHEQIDGETEKHQVHGRGQ